MTLKMVDPHAEIIHQNQVASNLI